MTASLCLLCSCVAVSYLPLAHIYERNNMTTAVHLGGSVGFYSGNVQELLDDVLVGCCFIHLCIS